MLPDWNDLPNDCREAVIKAAGWFTEDWEAGQCALDMYIELQKTFPQQVFPLFQSSDGTAGKADPQRERPLGEDTSRKGAGAAPGPSDADLVQRLRSHVNNRGGPAKDEAGKFVGTVWPMLLEAADEIEALRCDLVRRKYLASVFGALGYR